MLLGQETRWGERGAFWGTGIGAQWETEDRAQFHSDLSIGWGLFHSIPMRGERTGLGKEQRPDTSRTSNDRTLGLPIRSSAGAGSPARATGCKRSDEEDRSSAGHGGLPDRNVQTQFVSYILLSTNSNSPTKFRQNMYIDGL